MAQDPYQELGVSKSASNEDIRAAYRKLAKKYHPDLNKGDTAAEDRFKSVSAAWDILGDDTKKAKYDRGEIDANGNDRHPGFGGFGQGGTQGGHHGQSADFGDIFSDLFGAARHQGQQRMRGQDMRYNMQVDFMEAAKGAKKRIKVNGVTEDSQILDITIPAGVSDGQSLRLRGKGPRGPFGGAAGDIYVDVKIKPHSYFTRDGLTVKLTVPISLKEALLGAKIQVPTISGNVSVKVPAGTSSGAQLRIKGRGVKNGKGQIGDQILTLNVKLPKELDQKTIKQISKLLPDEDPRASMF